MVGSDSPMMNVLGTLPPCIFLSAFSVNTFTYARIYHSTLNQHTRAFYVATALIVVINCGIHTRDVVLRSRDLSNCCLICVYLTVLYIFAFLSYATTNAYHSFSITMSVWCASMTGVTSFVVVCPLFIVFVRFICVCVCVCSHHFS